MRFLRDVCGASRRMQNALVAQGHDVLSAIERNPRATDEEILALAIEERRILVTEDKDFGELVFVRLLLTQTSPVSENRPWNCSIVCEGRNRRINVDPWYKIVAV